MSTAARRERSATVSKSGKRRPGVHLVCTSSNIPGGGAQPCGAAIHTECRPTMTAGIDKSLAFKFLSGVTP